MTPTAEQRQRYLASGGSQCPACGSHSIESRGQDIGGDQNRQEVDCNDCGAGWVDVYTLSDIEPGEDIKPDDDA